jgi:hypothetical protein
MHRFSSRRRIARAGAALATLSVLVPAGTQGAAGWTAHTVPDIRVLTIAGDNVWAISYTVGSQSKMTATAFFRDTGKERWRIALDHMRTDVQHVEAVGTADSLFVAVGDPLDASKGYLLSLHVDPGAFSLSPARAGQRPGIAVIDSTLWVTTGGGDAPVRWRALDPTHTRFTRFLGAGGAAGCVGRPVKRGRFLIVPEGGGLTIAAASSGQVVRRVKVSTCTWGMPVVLGSVVAVMSTADTPGMTVAGVDPVAGRDRWRVPAPANPSRTPYVPTLTASGQVALATYAKTALVLDGAGKIRREIKLEGVTIATSAGKGRVVCALKSRAVVLVDCTAGTTRQLAKMDSEIGALLVARGHVYVAASEELRDLGSL